MKAITASEIQVGDFITEIDTPKGPWYKVLRIHANGRIIVETDDGFTTIIQTRSLNVLLVHDENGGR